MVWKASNEAMSYTFDTGRTLSQRQTVVEQVIIRLARLHRINGGFLHAIMPFGGIVRSYTDDDGIEHIWNTCEGQMPCALVGLGDGQHTPAGGGAGGYSHSTALEVIVYFVNDHAAGLPRVLQDTASIASDIEDPGVWYAMERVQELLAGFDIAGSDIKQLVPQRCEELATTPGYTLWRSVYEVKLARSLKPKRDVTVTLAGITTVVHDTSDSGDQPSPSSVVVETNLEPDSP
jgi:hypothetical protein